MFVFIEFCKKSIVHCVINQNKNFPCYGISILFNCITIPWIFEKHSIPIDSKARLKFQFGHLTYINHIYVNDREILLNVLKFPIHINEQITFYQYGLVRVFNSQCKEYKNNIINIMVDDHLLEFFGDFSFILKSDSTELVSCGYDKFYSQCNSFNRFNYQFYNKDKLCIFNISIYGILGVYPHINSFIGLQASPASFTPADL